MSVTQRVRRVVVSQNENGDSVVTRDDFAPALGRGALVWASPTLPADNLEQNDGGIANVIQSAPEGSLAFLWTFPPGHRSRMHQTDTLDYVYIISGSITLVLDNDVRVNVAAGEMIVQRGAAHGWENNTSEECKLLATAIRAHKISAQRYPSTGS